jgi:hypothetical protein
MRAPLEEEGGLLPRAYTMSIGFYGSEDLLMCLPQGFADLKYIEKRIV